MRTLLRAPGKPFHPPLTDASIGAYTAGVVMLVLGALSVEEEQMAHGALLAISVGLAVAAPTALTGLLDWLDIPKGPPPEPACLTSGEGGGMLARTVAEGCGKEGHEQS